MNKKRNIWMKSHREEIGIEGLEGTRRYKTSCSNTHKQKFTLNHKLICIEEAERKHLCINN